MEKRNLWHTISAAEILNSYCSTSEAGLTSLQASEMREKYGSNVLSRKKGKSIWQRLSAALFEPMQLLLIASVVIALAVNVIRLLLGQETDFVECAGILIAIMLSVLITVLMEGKSAKAFEALNKWNSDSPVRVIRDGKVVLLPRSEVVTGDVVKLETGDKLPADGRLLTAVDLEVDESSLTGESVPVLKDAGFVAESADLPLADRKNMLYSGTYITSGNGLMLVSAVGNFSEFGKLAGELSGDDESQTPLQEKLAKLGGRIAIFGIVAAAVVFAVQTLGFILSGTASLENISNAFITSIVLIVACVPEGLPTIVAVALAISIIKMSRQKMLVKKLVACETAGSINLICSDKTGTLTENRMTVIKVWSNGEVFEPDAVCNSELLENLSVNSTADVYLENGSLRRVGNPTETALLGSAVSSGCDYRQLRAGVRVLHTFVFSSETKNMTTILEAGSGMKVLTKGSPEKILAMCDIASDELKAAQNAIADFQSRAGRVIGFAHKTVAARTEDFDACRGELESRLTFDGFAVISDPLRKDVYDALSRCRSAGIDVKILTGDNLITARAIAGELDLLDDEHLAVEAVELEKLDDRKFALILPKIRVIARSTPLVKLRVVKTLKALGNVVAVTGDGINDAPAIKNADIGVAMGITGTEVSKEAGDIVLLDDSFSTLVRAVHWGRGIYENFQRFIQFQLTVNLSSVVVVLVSTLSGLTAPFSALQLLWVNLIMDGPPALTLGLEPIRDNLMDRDPVNRNASIVTPGMLLSIFAGGLFISLVVLGQIFGNFLGAGDAEKSTVVFALFVVFQLFNAFNCRELNGSSLFANFTRNRLMLSVFALTVVMQFAIIQWGGKVFKTVPLSGILWLKIILCAFTVILFFEITKLLHKIAGRRN